MIKIQDAFHLAGLIGPQTLVIFDVDNTLMVPNDMILRPPGAALFKLMAEEHALKLGLDRLRHLSSVLFLQRTITLVEEDMPKIIKNLQAQNAKVIALTAMRTGEYGMIPSMEDWRYAELKNLGIDFSQTFPELPPVIFHELSEFETLPTFKHGIISSGYHTKGAVLMAFLHRIQWLPEKVIFIDDHLECIESVKGVLVPLGVEVAGFHYSASHLQVGEVDPQIAALQFKHLADNEIWLSDAQARAKLKAEE